MENEEEKPQKTIGETHKRREMMADGKRYIIFYTFGDERVELPKKVSENV